MPAHSLSDTQLDVLREVTNIGIGNAVATLADMTQRKLLMSVPDVKSVCLAAVPELLGTDQPTVAVYMPISGVLEGHMALMLGWEAAGELWDMFVGSRPASVWQMDEMYASSMLEVGNIVLSSFVNAIGSLTSGRCDASPPLLAVDRPDVLLESIVSHAWAEQSEALSLDTDLREEGRATSGFFLYIPSAGSLDPLFDALEVREEAA